ncbi:GTPase [Halomonas koreensis]|uniref:50S ribosome-binding GTPase n=1 Tax=Halomonas koreensis TaxID=245385 RepID=A0ABU1G5I2_9GAMM|nr:GTPase [Halomonas koreensis]MDR5868160.1 50S ribosome-binding GTPase [Halomonas koreensis]
MRIQDVPTQLATLDSELSQEVGELLEMPEPESVFTVAAMGLYNAGKSTLLNALADGVEHEHFRTAAARETRRIQRLDLEGYQLLDTPGIDAEAADDAEAFDGILRSDLLLMVHSLLLGELDAQTLDYLGRVSRQSEQPLHERMICVLTHAEGRGGSEALESTIRDQLAEVCGGVPACYPVSNTSYLKGRREGKALLVTKSGIPTLQSEISYRIENLRERLVQLRADKRRQRLKDARELVMERMLEQFEAAEQARETLSHQLHAAETGLAETRRQLREMLAD